MLHDAIGIADPGPRPRYSQRPFPAYRYLPGVHPHPFRDPQGHSHGAERGRGPSPNWRPEEWRTLDDWLFGVDLFNAHYFWEAHEAWEGLWAVVRRGTAPSLLLQGLIQISAALLKAHQRNSAGIRVLSREGLEKLRAVRSPTGSLMGVDLAKAIAAFAAFFGSGEEIPDLERVPVLILE